MGGSDDPSNIYECKNVEEHAELHLSLYLDHGRLEDWLAFNGLAGMISDEERIYYKQVIGSRKGGEAAAIVHRGKKQSPEHIEKLRKTRIGRSAPNKIDDGLTNAQRYYRNNKEKLRANRKEQYYKNRQKELDSAKLYRDNHKDQIKAYNKKYYEDHKY